jgi:cytohesin
MSDIKFNCPQCGQHIAVDATGAGMTVACPQCSLAILVPQPAQLAGQEPPRRPKRWWLLSAGIAAAMLIAGLLIWQAPWRKTTAAGPAAASLTDNAASRKLAGNPQATKGTNPPAPQIPPAKDTGVNIEIFALPKAAYEGNLEEVKALIAKGTDVNLREMKDTNITPIFFAVSKGREDVRGMFDNSNFKKINELKDRTKKVGYPRQYAEIVSLLLAHGADVNATNSYGQTPLHWAGYFGYFDMAELLVAKGADVNARDNGGATPLSIAALENHKDMENLLMAKGAKVDIFIASAMGDIERVKGFLKNDTNLINVAQGVSTPLHIAALSGQLESAKFLIEKGANVDAGYPKKPTPLYFAALKGHLDVAEMFINKGANINSEAYPPLQGAAWGGNKAIGELLIAKGADVNAKDGNGWTPLFAAAMTDKGGKDMAELLIAKGADVNAKDPDGRTPLWATVGPNHLEIARLLVSKGADINAKYAKGNTALNIAARFAQKDFVEFLLANGADIHTAKDAGWTPLHHAALGGNKDIVEMLLVKGADVNAKDNSGTTPSFVADGEGYPEIAELMRKYRDKGKLKVPAANGISSLSNTGLVAYYSFNGNANDQSGNGNNGTVHGAVYENYSSGQTVLHFNGTATTYVVVPKSVSLEPQDAITVSLWCKGVPGTGQNYGTILRKADGCAAGYIIRTANSSGSEMTEKFRLDPPNPCAGGNASVAPFTPSTGVSWQHLVATYSRNDGLITYVNGVLISQTTPMGQLQHSGDLFIGGATTGGQDGGFNGLIREVRIYNRALSTDEVQALYNNEAANKP